MAWKYTGKRGKHTRRCSCVRWLVIPAALLVLGGLVVKVTGIADSPQKLPADDEAHVEQEDSAGEAPVKSSAEDAVNPSPWALRQPSVAERDPFLPDIHKSKAMARSTDPVDDSYFSDAVFLGDSRTEGFMLYSGLKEGTYLFSVGATVDTVLDKKVSTPSGQKTLVDAMKSLNLSKVYIMLGVNELGWVSADRFQEHYGNVVDQVRKDHPNAKVVIQSILPVSAEQEAKGTYVNNGRILKYNELLKTLAKEKNCTYMNIAEVVTDKDGCLFQEMSADGVHLNRNGCQTWLQYLRTHAV